MARRMKDDIRALGELFTQTNVDGGIGFTRGSEQTFTIEDPPERFERLVEHDWVVPVPDDENTYHFSYAGYAIGRWQSLDSNNTLEDQSVKKFVRTAGAKIGLKLR